MTPEAAMIFAAGLGTRMGDLTEYCPKPMLPILGRPMVDYSIDLLRAAGVGRIVANTHYQPKLLSQHLEEAGVLVSHEDPIMETGGGLRAALPLLATDPVITINPDVVWKGPNPIVELARSWQPHMQALLMLVPLGRALGSGPKGDFSFEKGEILRGGPYRYTGLQILRTDLLADIQEDIFSLNAYWDYLATHGPLNGTVYSGQWCDAGSPEGLTMAEELLRA